MANTAPIKPVLKTEKLDTPEAVEEFTKRCLAVRTYLHASNTSVSVLIDPSTVPHLIDSIQTATFLEMPDDEEEPAIYLV